MKHSEPFSVIYKDDSIAVLNKAPGLSVAADRWDPDAPRLDKAAAGELCGEGGRLYAVHRIDKDTSGVVVYALTPAAHRKLCLDFEHRRVRKTYHALIYGRPDWRRFTADAPLRANGDKAHRTVPDKHAGKKAVTEFFNIGSCGAFSWIEARPLTGRTHQIRAHLAWLGYSIVCDALYGKGEPLFLSKIKRSWRGDAFEERPLINRMGLHAFALKFAHPETGERLEFTAPYPKDMNALRTQLAKLYGVDPLAPPAFSPEDRISSENPVSPEERRVSPEKE